MSEEDLELLITIDDPGEDTLEEDNFHLQAHGSCCSNIVSDQLDLEFQLR